RRGSPRPVCRGASVTLLDDLVGCVLGLARLSTSLLFLIEGLLLSALTSFLGGFVTGFLLTLIGRLDIVREPARRLLIRLERNLDARLLHRAGREEIKY